MVSYVPLENKTTFFIIYSNLLLLNPQMGQIILTQPVYIEGALVEWQNCGFVIKLIPHSTSQGAPCISNIYIYMCVCVHVWNIALKLKS